MALKNNLDTPLHHTNNFVYDYNYFTSKYFTFLQQFSLLPFFFSGIVQDNSSNGAIDLDSSNEHSLTVLTNLPTNILYSSIPVAYGSPSYNETATDPDFNLEMANIESSDNNVSHNPDHIPEMAEPNGNTRGRKRLRTTSERINRDCSKHPILPPCGHKCKKKCRNMFNETHRHKLNTAFWIQNFLGRRNWLLAHVKAVAIKRHRSGMKENNKLHNCHRNYYLPSTQERVPQPNDLPAQDAAPIITDMAVLNEDSANVPNITNKATASTVLLPDDRPVNIDVPNTESSPILSLQVAVCQRLFLSTLGYSSDRVIIELFKSVETTTEVPMDDKRGKHEPHNKLDHQIISNHILTFNPVIPHYRREHAPNRRYLPEDLSIKAMHQDFVTKMGNFCSYRLYCKVLQEMNISFASVQADKCGECRFYELNATTDQQKNVWKYHVESQQAARLQYNTDDAIQDIDTLVYCADLQKVLLLPRMPKLKSSFFCSRLVTFNETFAMMDSKNKRIRKNHYCVIWTEAISGRKAGDIVSSFAAFFIKVRDTKKIILWLDNCSAQNKNWCLITALTTMVNNGIAPKEVILRYLVPGHTEMAADGLHGLIEQKMRKKRNVEDYEDLTTLINEAVTAINVIDLECKDFRDWQSFAKACNADNGIPLLKNICEIRFLKGYFKFWYKTKFDGEQMECDFISKKSKTLIKKLPPNKTTPRGILTTKKKKILKQLVPNM